jgi:hypothetical protein
MDTVMVRSSLRRFVFILVLALGIAPPVARAGVPERLKWVRGTVDSVTSDSMTTRLENKTLRIMIDNATEVMLVTPDGVTRASSAVPATAYLEPGKAVEVHYRPGRPSGTAHYIWVGIPLDAKSVSKRPGSSAAGSITVIKSAHWLAPPRMTVTSGKDHRSFQVLSGTQSMDVEGTVAPAKSRLPPAAGAMEPQDRVVIIYRQHKSTLKAQLIRMLPQRP